METAVKHKCKNGCGYEHEHRGTMNLHERMHCKKKQGGDDGEMNSEKKKPGGSSRGSGTATKETKLECDCADGPTLAFMNKQDPRLAGAIRAGFKRICEECGEVFK